MQKAMRFTQIEKCVGVFRIRLNLLFVKLDRFLVFVLRFSFLVQRRVSLAQAQVRLGIIGIDFQSLLEDFRRLFVLIVLIEFIALINQSLSLAFCLFGISNGTGSSVAICVGVPV